jgi:hypothetical protein
MDATMPRLDATSSCAEGVVFMRPEGVSARLGSWTRWGPRWVARFATLDLRSGSIRVHVNKSDSLRGTDPEFTIVLHEEDSLSPLRVDTPPGAVELGERGEWPGLPPLAVPPRIL